MELDFRKPFIALGIVIGIWWYISSHYTVQDVLDYTKRNPDLSSGPTIVYYIGMGYFTRSDYEEANRAFTQLLAEYTTTQYTPNALLRMGEISEEKMNWAGARDAYQQYITRFPDGHDFKLVEGKLDQIKFK